MLALLASAIVEVSRELARRMPPPRGMPFYGLDHPAGEFEPFTGLAAHGIFRKYETVLLLGSGLGGASRWCHTHFGCDVTGIEPQAGVGVAASLLSSRAGLSAHTRYLAAVREGLPVRTRSFTHAWGVEGFDGVAAGDPGLREIFRAVRLGGLIGLQQTHAPAAWADRAAEALVSVGFVEARQHVVSRPPLRHQCAQARPRLLQRLQESGAVGAEAATALERVFARWPATGGPVTQVFARRPS